MIVLWILSAILALILLLSVVLIVALSVPVALRVSNARAETTRVEVVWLFGAVRVRLDAGAAGRAKRRQRRARKRKRPGEGSKSAPQHLPPGGARELLSLARPILATVRRVIRRFQITGDSDLYLGLPDPADTGRLWGQGYLLFARISTATGIGIYPAFDGLTARIDGTVAIRAIPIALGFPVLRLLVSRDGRRMIRLIRRSR
jgi:hypothetical protein